MARLGSMCADTSSATTQLSHPILKPCCELEHVGRQFCGPSTAHRLSQTWLHPHSGRSLSSTRTRSYESWCILEFLLYEKAILECVLATHIEVALPRNHTWLGQVPCVHTDTSSHMRISLPYLIGANLGNFVHSGYIPGANK